MNNLQAAEAAKFDVRRKILIALHPEPATQILNGQKLEELRKRRFKPGDQVIIAITAGRPFVYHFSGENYRVTETSILKPARLNGKVVAEFVVGQVTGYEVEWHNDDSVMQRIMKLDDPTAVEDGEDDLEECVYSNEWPPEMNKGCALLKNACLSFDELGRYAAKKCGWGTVWSHQVTQLRIFEKPKELYDYADVNGEPIREMPQGWRYVWEYIDL